MVRWVRRLEIVGICAGQFEFCPDNKSVGVGQVVDRAHNRLKLLFVHIRAVLLTDCRESIARLDGDCQRGGRRLGFDHHRRSARGGNMLVCWNQRQHPSKEHRDHDRNDQAGSKPRPFLLISFCRCYYNSVCHSCIISFCIVLVQTRWIHSTIRLRRGKVYHISRHLSTRSRLIIEYRNTSGLILRDTIDSTLVCEWGIVDVSSKYQGKSIYIMVSIC